MVTVDATRLPLLAAGADLIIDCVDKLGTRYLLNQYCVDHGIGLLHAGVWGMGGQLALLQPPVIACLRCLFPEAPPDQGAIPALGAGAGLIGCEWLVQFP